MSPEQLRVEEALERSGLFSSNLKLPRTKDIFLRPFKTL